MLAKVENLFLCILVNVPVSSSLPFKAEGAQRILLITMGMGSVCVENPRLVNARRLIRTKKMNYNYCVSFTGKSHL